MTSRRSRSMADETCQPTLLRAAVWDLPPSYFAMVMATGIISMAAHMLGLTLVARLLFYLNGVAYVLLWLLHGLRLYWFPQRLVADMLDHARGPGYFTWVASSAVLGSQFVVLAHAYTAALALWILTSVLWVGLTYTFFTVFAVKKHKPPLQEGINGAWLLTVVATQAVAVLSAHIAADWPQPYRLELNFLALSMWLWGGMLYIWMIALIFYRYYFFPFSPSDLTPPFWISMGAMAISTLAGSLLIANSPDAPYLESLLPFLKGFTVFYWATGTWWVPMLLLLGIWRYVIKRFPLEYDPSYWGAVFPLGMYAAATEQMTRAMEFGFLGIIPKIFLYVSLLVWAITFVGLLRSMVRRARPYLSRIF
ncbi:tellurite resistance/C4-dicarboxylate transporter family protein [Halomonas sp. GXIMD04776]|uniref:tellurite resistance/C4-dicarboxylate transporter family protein n=1 Tax=Halomonas sp. GXIMD04776 TaxID=3415605 RepID=UPI003CC4515C